MYVFRFQNVRIWVNNFQMILIISYIEFTGFIFLIIRTVSYKTNMISCCSNMISGCSNMISGCSYMISCCSNMISCCSDMISGCSTMILYWSDMILACSILILQCFNRIKDGKEYELLILLLIKKITYGGYYL